MRTRSRLFAAMVLTVLLVVPFAASATAAQGSDAAVKILALENKRNISYQQRDVAAMSSLLPITSSSPWKTAHLQQVRIYRAYGGQQDESEQLGIAGHESAAAREHGGRHRALSRSGNRKREALRIPRPAHRHVDVYGRPLASECVALQRAH
jgi:hypothetical protein